MARRMDHRVAVLGTIMSGVVLQGCVGAGSGSLSTVVEALEGARNASPFVEAHVQYVGPDARWAGPALWTLHVSAKEGSAPAIDVTPRLPAVEPTDEVTVQQRTPASALGMTQMQAPADSTASGQRVTSEEIRERLVLLASTLQAAEQENQACSTAVRVRMVRADGSVLERQGCRASAQWSQVVSEFSAELMGASRYPAGIRPALPETVPAQGTAPAAEPAPAAAPVAAEGKASDHG